MSLKEEIADLFIDREQTKQRLAQIELCLQTKINELQQEKEDDGDTEDQPRQNSN